MSETRTAVAVDVAPLPSGRAAAARWAGPVAGLTRAAYALSDPYPGLPVPDGARETEDGVLRALERGSQVWLATGPDGRLAGALRVTDHGAAGWEVHRVSVDPVRQGQGIARTMLAAVEENARARGVPRLWLDAVVERCLPAVYGRLGFRAVRHWSADDKPLSETTLERVPGAPLPADALPLVDDPLGPSDLAVAWLPADGRLLAVLEAGGRPSELLARACARAGAEGAAGLDVWPGAGPDGRAWLAARLPEAGAAAGGHGIFSFPGGRERVAAHLMPRTLHPGLRAVLRLAPGRTHRPVPAAPSAHGTVGASPS
ncbi:GNAT family N-acetyltransferase [Streptomyces sp. NPDC051162]|uniref:GNAT family N-acetyltransferase n=1 Tax=unclassified Streptomyces TaxID=2593676 RepID=UPI003448A097